MCLPGLNDVAFAEKLAILVKLKCFSEIAGEVAYQPTLRDILEFRGDRMEPLPE